MSDPEWRGESESSESALAHIPSAPRNPSPRARALIFRYQGAQMVMVMVGGIFFVLGSILGTVFSWGAWGDLALASSPRLVTGHVIDAQLNYSVTVNRRHPTVIRFRYSDGDTEQVVQIGVDPGRVVVDNEGAHMVREGNGSDGLHGRHVAHRHGDPVGGH